jgi:tetratricopeptide (TPR) repeat protein
VFEALAAAYRAVGEPWKAVALLDECVEAVSEGAPDNVTLNVRYRSLLGTTYSSFGEVDRARTVLREATGLAEGYEVPSARVFLYWSCARVEWMEGDSEEALRYMALARAMLEVLGDTLQLARAHLASGQICTLDERPEEAAGHLEQAERLLVLAGEQDDIGLLRAEQAKVAAKRGDAPRALVYATAGLSALRDDVRYAPTAWHALGLAQAAVGDVDAAQEAFGHAVEGLARLRQWRQASQAARDWGNALRAAGRDRDAYELFERALLLTLRETPGRDG